MLSVVVARLNHRELRRRRRILRRWPQLYERPAPAINRQRVPGGYRMPDAVVEHRLWPRPESGVCMDAPVRAPRLGPAARALVHCAGGAGTSPSLVPVQKVLTV